MANASQQLFDSDEKERRGQAPPGNAYDDDIARLRDITGIGPDEERRIDDRERANDIGRREGLFNPHGDRGHRDGRAGQGAAGLGSGGRAMAGGAARLATSGNPVGLVAKGYQLLFGSSKRKKRSAATGIIVTILFALFGFSADSGYFEFEDIANFESNAHFASLQDESNNRFLKLARFVRYGPSGGKAYRTNMNSIGNVLADRIEARLKTQGLESSYNKYPGTKEGYIIDKSSPEYKGKSFDQVKQIVQNTYGDNINVVEGTNDTWLIEQPDGYRASLRFVRVTLQRAGMSKIVSGIAARIMGVRDGVSWHPLKRLDNRFKTLGAQAVEWFREKVANVDNGTTDAQLTAEANPADKTKSTQANADGAAGEAQGTITEGESTGTAVQAGDATATGKFSAKLTGKLTGGAVAIAGLLCLARTVAQAASDLKEAQLILPVIRMGMRAISMGNQLQFGGQAAGGTSDITNGQLAIESKQLYDPTTKTSWSDAESIQTIEGHPHSGVPPSNTLATMGSGSPFDFLLGGNYNTVLSPICSTAGQAVTTVVSFLGGPVSAVVGLVAGQVFGPLVVNALAHWLSHDAVDILARGANLGSILDFGAFLGANDQALSAGGADLSPGQALVLNNLTNGDNMAQFDEHSLAYRLFSPSDYHSLLATIMDRQSPVVTDNARSAVFAFLGVGRSLLSNFSSLFSGTGLAASTAFNYGNMPQIGFSVDEMDDPAVANPYANGDDVAAALSGPNGQHYIDLAQACFGDTLMQTTDTQGDQVWDVQYNATPVNVVAKTYKNVAAACSSHADKTWTKIRFFIFDTQTIKSADCFLANDEQVCTSVGFP